jgi:predicted small secreted protein
MKRRLIALAAAAGVLVLTACATVAGTAIGAGIGSISGDTQTGAMIGGGAGLLYDVFE